MATLTNTAKESPENRRVRIFDTELAPLMHQVCTFALRLTGDPTRSDDLAQETYLRAWRAIDHYEEGTNAKAWLFRICQNLFINEYRKRGRQPQAMDYEDIVVWHNRDDDGGAQRYSELHEEYGNNLLGDEAMRAINSLKPEFRVVVLLDLEDFKYKEIAAILDIPLNTVRTRLFRARKLLREQLEAYAKAKGYNVQDDAVGVEDKE